MDNAQQTDPGAERDRQEEREHDSDTSPAADTPLALPADDDSDLGDTDQHSDA
jgi:hypothetical protein